MSAAAPRPDPGFVGRSDEVNRLTEVLRTALVGRAPLCLVLGEAGIGKSRLADRVAVEARTLGYDVAWAEAEPGCGPFAALAGLRVPGWSRPDDGDDPRWERLDRIADGIAARAPLLVIVEDLHWADDSSVWVVERLGRQLAGVSAPVLVTARSDEMEPAALARLVTAADQVVRLSGMSESETTRLAELAAPGSSVDGAGLWERTGGVPLFVREAAVLAADGGPAPLATTVLRRRIERLGAHAGRVLAALALAPPQTSLVVLARALQCPVEAVVAAIDVARAEDIVVDGTGGGVRFRHALLAEAAGDGMEAGARRTLRLALADGLAADGTTTARAGAARQRLLALPAGDPAVAATAAMEAVVALRAAGDGATATALAALAAEALDRYGAARDVVARLQVERGEALFALGERRGARGCVRGRRGQAPGRPELRARTEAGRARFVPPVRTFGPDLIRRLSDAADALADADSALRARLLGRISAASVATPSAQELGRRAAEEAVAIARRLGDPAVLVQALSDRHLAPATPEEWVERGRAADEIVALGERLGRPEVALLGYEWQFGERLGVGDVPGAEDALGRLELYAQLVPSPEWRFSGGLRRAALDCLFGHRDRGLRTFEAAVADAQGWLQDEERAGIAMTFRASTALMLDVADPELDDLVAQCEVFAGRYPAGFLHAQVALAAWTAGDAERARRSLARTVAAGVDEMAVGLESLHALVASGLVAAALGDRRAVRLIRPRLEPFAGRLSSGSGAVVLPVGTTLGLLAEAEEDHRAAAGYHRRGIEAAQRAGAQVLVDRCRALAGSTAPRAPVPAGHATITRGPEGWTLSAPFGTATVEESRGLLQLIEVLRAGGRDLSALDLAAADGGVPVQADLGPALDGRAKREYRARIADLREEIDDAEQMNDPDRGTRARLELDALLDELGRAVGLGGRDRPQGATDERARVNVTRSIRRAIQAVAAQAPDLATHLQVSVRTGRACRYQPDPAAALRWEVASAGG